MTLEERRPAKELIEEIHAFKRKNQRFRGNLSGVCKAKPKVKIDPVVSQMMRVGQTMEIELKPEEMHDIDMENRFTE